MFEVGGLFNLSLVSFVYGVFGEHSTQTKMKMTDPLEI